MEQPICFLFSVFSLNCLSSLKFPENQNISFNQVTRRAASVPEKTIHRESGREEALRQSNFDGAESCRCSVSAFRPFKSLREKVQTFQSRSRCKVGEKGARHKVVGVSRLGRLISSIGFKDRE